jgi:hypothetical protein
VTQKAAEPVMSLREVPDPQKVALEERKDEVLRQLAYCESGGSGPSERPIYGGRGTFHGRFQFTLSTLRSYVIKRDGMALSYAEAKEWAHDYERAGSVARYMIFDLEEHWHWPLCSRKLGIAAEVRAIKLSEETLTAARTTMAAK